MTLGERLIMLRSKAGLSQDDLAGRLGVSRQSVSKWENNVSVPDLDKLVKLSEVFGVSLDELVRGNVPGPADHIAKAGVTAEELRLHRQRLLGLLLLLASVLLGSHSEGTWGILFAWPLVTCGILCLLCRRPLGLLCAWGAWLTHFVSVGASLFYIFEGTRIDNFVALTVIVPLGVLTVYSLRHPPSLPICWFLLAAALYQYRNIWWFFSEPLSYLDLFRLSALPAGGKFLTLYWLAMLLLTAANTVRKWRNSRRRSSEARSNL
ncbi:MAG TPA: helix-turn-helix domain-containing protein [Candidatus Oscillibacter excrementigallinarum]|uniref:Helix-turn-helix domain-containing protein n=1 Tax=Candidatus Oscillibacter excrementigallinarum TaxID=2838716 RepID=A0A9D2RSG4_9FIRM|nr:helix-turn-helix domain-containing protein [Candidatus Oscillibacter excrementigallinarum]